MTVMVVGGDHLGKITGSLQEKGYDDIKHLTGRKISPVTKMISDNIDLILVLTDYVGTDLSRVVKIKAKKQGIQVAFARRSWSCICRELDRVCPEPCNNSCRSGAMITVNQPGHCGKEGACGSQPGENKKCCRGGAHQCKCG